MKTKICCFAGHSKLHNSPGLESSLYKKCEELVLKKGVTIFRVGNYGSFDHLAARTVQSLKKKYPYIKSELFLPYITKEINENCSLYYKKFDSIVVANIPENTPARLKIIKCNQYMVSHCNFLICFVLHSFGGAAKTLDYARKKGLEIYNLRNI